MSEDRTMSHLEAFMSPAADSGGEWSDGRGRRYCKVAGQLLVAESALHPWASTYEQVACMKGDVYFVASKPAIVGLRDAIISGRPFRRAGSEGRWFVATREAEMEYGYKLENFLDERICPEDIVESKFEIMSSSSHDVLK